MDRLGPLREGASLVAVSNTAVRHVIIDVQGKGVIRFSEQSTHPVSTAAWLKNGKAFITARGGTVGVNPVAGAEAAFSALLKLPGGPAICRISGDGKCLVVVQGNTKELQVFDLFPLLNQKPGTSLKPLIKLEDGDAPIVAVASSCCSNHMAASNANGSVYLYEIGEKARCSLGLLPCGPTVAAKKRCLAFSQTTSPMMLAAGCDDGQVVVWQLQGKSWLPQVLPAKGKGRVMGVGFAPLHGHTSGLLLACTEEGGLVMTDLRGVTFGAKQQPNLTQRRLEIGAPVSTMSLSDDGNGIAMGTKDGRLGLLRTEELVAKPEEAIANVHVLELGTRLDVADIAWRPQHTRSGSMSGSRELRDSGGLASAEAAAAGGQQAAPAASRTAAPGAVAGHTTAAGAGSGSGAGVGAKLSVEWRRGSGVMGAVGVARRLSEEGRRSSLTGSGAAAAPGANAGAPPLKEATNNVIQQPQAGTAGLLKQGFEGLADKGTVAAAHGAVVAAAGPKFGQQQQQQPTAGSTGTGVTGTSGRPQSASTTAGGRGLPMASLSIPSGPHRRSSDAGGGLPLHPGPAATTTTAPQPSEHPVPVPEQAPSFQTGAPQPLSGPPAMPQAVSLLGAVALSSPTASPSRGRISLAGTGPGPMGRPVGGAADQAANMISRGLEDMRGEMRELVRGLQADMVRQFLSQEMAFQAQVQYLLEENRQLRGEVAGLRQQLQDVVRFRVLN